MSVITITHSFRFLLCLTTLALFISLPNPATAETLPALWTGSGGSGTTITITEPAGRGLSAEDHSLIPLMQSTVIGVFQRFSAMTVFDRQNLEKIIAEQKLAASGYFSDDDFISIGQLTNARLVVLGSITAVAGNYMLEFAVTDVESGERKASYPPRQVSLLALRDLSAIRNASADLLGQLGVRLTETALQELRTAEDSSRIEAENALAMGIAAQRQGTGVEAMMYFFKAASLDPAMREALNRASVVSANVAAGNMTANIQNRMQEYRNWVAVLDAAGEFYSANLPYQFEYDVKIRNQAIDYARGTADFSVAVSLAPRRDAWNTINDLRRGLTRAARGEWDHIPLRKRQIVEPEYISITVRLELANANGDFLSAVAYTFSELSESKRINRELLFSSVNTDRMGTGTLIVRVASVNGIPTQQAGETGLLQISAANLWGTLGRERFGNAFVAKWRDLRRRGRNGIEIGAGHLWMNNDGIKEQSFAWFGGAYFSPIPFTTLGIEVRVGTSTDEKYWVTKKDDAGEKKTNFRWAGDLYFTGAPVVGAVFPLGKKARIYTAALVELGTFGIWTGWLTDWATPGIEAGLEFGLGMANGGTGISLSTEYRGILYEEGFANGFNIGIGFRF